MATTAQSSAQNAAQLRTNNMAARQLIVSNAVDLWQPIAQGSVTNFVAGQALPVNIPVRNIGLIKRFVIEIVGQVNCAAGHGLTLTKTGGPNFFSNVTMTDLNNQTRVSTTGWHLHYLATFRRQLAYGAAFTNTDSISSGTGIGNNLTSIANTIMPRWLTLLGLE